jgi:hypothetical protein
MHVVAADFRVRITVAVEQRERLRRILDRGIHDVRREQDAPVRVGFQAMVEHALAQLFATNFHARFRHDAFRLIQDFRYQLFRKYA